MRQELYTSRVRLKAALNGGGLAPVTPLPQAARKLIDPAFTINGDGLGGLVEDARRGLRCPVRGCGKWFHNLSYHITRTHLALGGVAAVRDALSIPKSAPMASAKLRAKLSDGRAGVPLMVYRYKPRPKTISKEVRAKIATSVRATKTSVNTKNLKDRCEAQLKHKLIDLHHKIGRSPTCAEARGVWGDALVAAVIHTFGTWNSAKAQCGLEACVGPKKGQGAIPIEQVLTGLSAWYDMHGDLPLADDTVRADRVPAIPGYRATLRALGAQSWPDAMERAASLLNIYGGRYGLPERKPAA